MNERRIVVVSAGLSQPSSTRLLADGLAEAVRHELAGAGVVAHVQVVELRDHAHDVVNTMLTGFAPAAFRPVLEAVEAADGLVVVTPTFSASYSGLFKSFVDVLDKDALAGKPVLVAATGGTARHSLVLEHALRPLFAYLRAVVVPTAVYAAAEDWAGGSAGGELRDRIGRAARELADEVARRAPATVEDPFALTTSFADMLAGD